MGLGATEHETIPRGKWQIAQRDRLFASDPKQQAIQWVVLTQKELHPLSSKWQQFPSAVSPSSAVNDDGKECHIQQEPTVEEDQSHQQPLEAQEELDEEDHADKADGQDVAAICQEQLQPDKPPATIEKDDHHDQENEPRAATQKTELVMLQDGDLDPLGVLTGSMPSMMTTTSKVTGPPPQQQRVQKVNSVKSNDNTTTTTDSCSSSSKSSSQTNVSTASPPSSDMSSLDAKTLRQSWKEHKDRLLAKYADETFRIKASMLEANVHETEVSLAPRVEFYQEKESVDTDDIAVIRKTRARLEYLEQSQEAASSGKHHEEATVEISQSEYIKRIQGMQKELVQAWHRNQKVWALRIAIKCVKLLGDMSNPQLYPCVFVLVSDVLDCFGELVFERIRIRASEDENGHPLATSLPEAFTSADINTQAKETCRNWFYKTACIRELLPRIYIEIALLKSYRFLCDGEYAQIAARLSNMIKGVGEPMVALYMQLYLTLVSSELLPVHEKTAISSALYDYFYTFHQFDMEKLMKFLIHHKMTQEEYLSLHSPAVEWMMKQCAKEADQSVFDALLAHYQQFSDNSMVLKHFIECFGAQYYQTKPLEMLQLIRLSTPSQYSKSDLYSLLAVQLASLNDSATNVNHELMLQFLNDAWTSITTQENIEQFMECAGAFMKFIVAYFTHREALILMKDVQRHLNCATPDELTTKTYGYLGSLIGYVIEGVENGQFEYISKLLPSSEFLTLMGMFKREANVNVAKKVLEAFVRPKGSKKNSTKVNQHLRIGVTGPEAAIAQTLFVICCRVHDSLSSLSSASEKLEVARDICAFISRLGMFTKEEAHEEEEEALLLMYIDCRSAFYKLERVKAILSMRVLMLAMQVRNRVYGGNSSGSSSSTETSTINEQKGRRRKSRRHFIKSCLAFAHITIPSISDTVHKLQLMVLCAKVALFNNCLPQLDAFLKASIMLVTEVEVDRIIDGPVDPESMEFGRIPVDFDVVKPEALHEEWLMSSANTSATEHDLLSCVGELINLLIYAPSAVQDDPFYLANGLKKAVCLEETSFKWKSLRYKVMAMLSYLQLLGLWGQNRLPNRLQGVDSNDVLYGGSDTFHNLVSEELAELADRIYETVVGSLGSDSSSSNHSKAKLQDQMLALELMLDVLNQVLTFATLADGAFIQKCVGFIKSSRKGIGLGQDISSMQTLYARDLEQYYQNVRSLWRRWKTAQRQTPALIA